MIQGRVTGLFSSRKRLSVVRVIGMHMIVPPEIHEEGNNCTILNSGPGGKSLAISKITADGTGLEFLRKDRKEKPYVLKIDHLDITDVGSGAPISYRATPTNTTSVGFQGPNLPSERTSPGGSGEPRRFPAHIRTTTSNWAIS